MTRDEIHFHINGQPHRIHAGEATLTLSDYLRRRRNLVGTKIVCSEGDCGACTVLVARLDEDAEPTYRPVDACITFLFQLDHTHVLTVEGLAESGRLNVVQQAMVDGHGSQCGFCTPGFVVTMTGLCEDAHRAGQQHIEPEQLRYGLTGNLCRCTGYVQIVEAGAKIDAAGGTPLCKRYPVAPMREAFAGDEPSVRLTEGDIDVCIAASIDEAAAFIAERPGARIVSGATDVGVAVNKNRYALNHVLCLNGIAAMKRVAYDNGEIVIGAATPWSDVLTFCREGLPEFAEVLDVFGAPQIRNAGTIGGNIINASPIADALPLLFVTEAQLTLVSTAGRRVVAINDFYVGYKKFDLRPGELLVEVRLTRPKPNQRLRLYKVSKRRDLDISTFTAAILLTMNGPIITDAALAYGGVAPVVLRLPKTEAALRGQALSESLMLEAGAIAQREIKPISDVRGSADYRLELARTILLKAYHDIAPADASATPA
ncbi:MAG: 2Fe-2S iron-sulfur cluster binding domain-containing protein [Planctomycetes bacterium]|nr:2Fe-2S iron-sulfur cluster binding domain-containing protein [Planctomycetota bacterium]